MKKIIIILLFIAYDSFSQSLSVFDIDTSSFPTIKAKFYAFDNSGNQILNLSPSDFEVTEDGVKRIVTYVSCPAPKPPVPISSVLTIDVSGSMSGTGLSIAKTATKAWVNTIPLGKSECAITSFTTSNNIEQDFTTKKERLLDAIDRLRTDGGTDFDAALIEPMSGALLIADNGKYKKVIVFLTDGNPNYPPKESEIINRAKSDSVVIYSVVLDENCPQSLKNISEQTGGLWFDNIRTQEEAEEVYRKILMISQGGDACDLDWESEGCDFTRELDISIPKELINTQIRYRIPYANLPGLTINPLTLKFGFETATQQATITAKVQAIEIQSITANNTKFEITDSGGNSPPFSLNPGEQRTLTIKYTPTDSSYQFCKIEIKSNACTGKYIYAYGGDRSKRAAQRTIKLLQPNGGEVFVGGSDTVIIWEGVSPDDTVTIEYRTADTEPWVKLKDTAIGLSYNFRVPKIPSSKYLAKVTAKTGYSTSCEDVQICNQTWMGCNLDVDTYRNGDPIRYAETNAEWYDANNKGEGAWCYYNNDPSNGEIYGKFYNWYAVNDPRGLARDGWHVPTDAEWTELVDCLGGSSVAGGKLKSTGTKEGGDGLWNSPNTGATNESGFSALPGGRCISDGTFMNIGYYGHWWSATETNATNAWYSEMYYDYSSISRTNYDKENGLSVRCVRDY